MIKYISTMVALALAMATNGAVFESGDFRLDLVTGNRMMGESALIRYSSEWEDGSSSDSDVVISINGIESSRTNGVGVWEWARPNHAGTYTITHKVFKDGVQIGETLSAIFVVEGPSAPEFQESTGTIFEDSMSVNISCSTDGAVIHYTIDGSEPTDASPVYKRFRIYDRTLIRAVAVKEGMAMRPVTSVEYALGKCMNPVIMPPDGTVFEHSNQEVSISWNNVDGILHYTLDGSTPTTESSVYSGAFMIGESTVVKAKVIGSSYFDSEVIVSTLIRERHKVSNPVISAQGSFRGLMTTAVIECDTDGAFIRYTIDGSDPTENGMMYTGPIEVTATTVIRAVALLADWAPSDTVDFTINKVWGIGDALNDPDMFFTTDVESGWRRDENVCRDGVESMRSGAIKSATESGQYNETRMTATIKGKGTVRFWWKASCEEDPLQEWDHGEFRADGRRVTCIDGETDWQEVVFEFSTGEDHEIAWVYLKDDFGDDGQDCIWVDMFSWTPSEVTTDTIPDLGQHPTADEVLSVVGDAADSQITIKIDQTNYNDFRDWVGKVKMKSGSAAGAQGVMNADNAWMSYALGQDTLLDVAPTDEDLSVETFEPAAESGKFDFTVSVKDIEIGSEAVKENLKKVFGLEGASTLDGAAFSSDKVDIEFGTPVDGKVKFTAGPKDASAGAFFMKVKILP